MTCSLVIAFESQFIDMNLVIQLGKKKNAVENFFRDPNGYAVYHMIIID